MPTCIYSMSYGLSIDAECAYGNIKGTCTRLVGTYLGHGEEGGWVNVMDIVAGITGPWKREWRSKESVWTWRLHVQTDSLGLHYVQFTLCLGIDVTTRTSDWSHSTCKGVESRWYTGRNRPQVSRGFEVGGDAEGIALSRWAYSVRLVEPQVIVYRFFQSYVCAVELLWPLA